MKFLNSDQSARFAAVNARCGLGPEEFTAQLAVHELAALPSKRVMASTGHTDYPPHIISIGSVEDMRKLVGLGAFVPPTSGAEPYYPPEPAKAEVEHVLSAAKAMAKPQVDHELKERIEQAAIAYIVGNPAKVAAYVPLINALQFPSRVAVFSGESLDLPSGASHTIAGDDPVVLNFGKISVAKGATIKVNARAYINAQVFEQEAGVAAAVGGSSYTIENIGAPWDKPADQGGQGPTGPVQTNHGTNGASYYNGSNCQWVCTTQPENGPAGNDGLKGLIGSPGAKGHPSAGGIYNLGLVTTPITMLIGGGDGQQGGKGGLGGAGGGGGTKGNAATGCGNSPSDGGQGRGGQGGNGGPGGDGGDSGYVTVYYSYTGQGQAPITVTVRTVAGGAGGLPGDPGPGVGNNGAGSTGTPRGNQGAIPKYALNKQ